MSMNMNMSGTPSCGNDVSISEDITAVLNNSTNTNEAARGGEARRAGSSDNGAVPNSVNRAIMADAAAAQQQTQLLHKTIGATRTGSTETATSSSNASIVRSNSHTSSIRSHTHPADSIHKPPKGQQEPAYPHPCIPVSRSNGSPGNSMYKPGKSHMASAGSQDFDQDHHTFATATTASATISYSTDEVDHVNSDASEAGMEVVMDSSDNNSSGDEQVREEQILSLLDPHSSRVSRMAKPKEDPYKSHTFPAGKHSFTVDTRYAFIRVIGSGAYGVVISAKDAKSEADVAIKMVPRAFHDEIDAKRILREIKLLKHFQHENVVGIQDMMPPSVNYVEDFNDVYMVTDLMETDLHRIIYSKQKLSMDHVQYFVYQVLRGLKYIHSCNVLHRDLKPSNLLVNSNCDLKICDFGLARGVYGDSDTMDQSSKTPKASLLLTEYVVTRWYRAPEIMLACHEYSKPIDVWSVGCIFAELILRKPYFPGDDYIDQLTIITDKLGKLPETELDFVTSDKAKRFMRKLPSKTPVPLSQQFPAASPEALDLLRKMLSVHPKKRISVEDALAHPFFRQLHSPEDEPVCDHGSFDFAFEDEHLHRRRLQELIWEEVGSFRPSVLPVAPSRSGVGLGNLDVSARSRSSRQDP